MDENETFSKVGISVLEDYCIFILETIKRQIHF